ncbi:hypothetical protein, partial [Pseudomonas aeruginosa]|uniref:hypothetical protein n=1 Tax=Pseudomonas aeruginosa TaxID=287 RepID=UPI002B40EC84
TQISKMDSIPSFCNKLIVVRNKGFRIDCQYLVLITFFPLPYSCEMDSESAGTSLEMLAIS